jgi:hypothetical protein
MVTLPVIKMNGITDLSDNILVWKSARRLRLDPSPKKIKLKFSCSRSIHFGKLESFVD